MNDEPEQPKNEQEDTNVNNETPEPAHQESMHEMAEEPAVSHLSHQEHAGRFAKFKAFYLGKKKFSIPLSVVLLLAILMAIPPTRYLLAGTVLKTNYQVSVLDESTKQPVSDVTVTLGGVSAVTDNNGLANVKVKVGNKQLTATKKYYQDYSSSVLVPIKKPKSALAVYVKATGRQVPVVVTNKISGKPIENASVKAADTEAKTDKEGKVVVVLPADQAELEATISADGFNDAKVTVKVTETALEENEFTLTPAGRIYFLSKQSGKIDVVKTYLDGTDRKTVLAGTGQEEEGNTVLLASRDWKYLALHSKREGKYSKLYLIETATDKVTTMDEGEATFTISGWADNYFVFKVERANVKSGEEKAQALKSYNAETKQLKILDETRADGSVSKFYTGFDSVFLLDGKVVYTSVPRPANYNSPTSDPTYQIDLMSIRPDGTSKKTIKNWIAGAWKDSSYGKYWDSNYVVDAYLSGPKELYFILEVSSKNEYYELHKDEFKQLDKESSEAKRTYLTYLESPSKNSVFWYEERDGKNNLFLGNSEAENPKEVAVLSEYGTYGWYTENYLLISKKGSELYIMPAAEKVSENQILKISDYHKPSYNYYGYGGGYGGI